MVYAPRSRSILRPQAVNDNNLVGWWPLDDGQANDFSGNHKPGTLNAAPTFTAGMTPGPACPPGALTFNGSTQYVNIPTNAALQITGAQTVAFWGKYTSAGDLTFVGRGVGGGAGGVYGIEAFTGKMFFSTSSTGSLWSKQVSTTGTYNDGNWHHFAAVYVPSTSMTIYADGQSAVSSASSIPSALFSNTTDINIGVFFNPTTVNWLAGSIDDVRVYNRALSGAEVFALYSSAFMPWMEAELPALKVPFFSRYYYDMSRAA